MAQILAASSSSSSIPTFSLHSGSNPPRVALPLLPSSPQQKQRPTPPLVSSSFKRGTPLVIQRSTQKNCECKAMPVSIRCEQSAKNSNGLDVWLGRLAMIGFATAITVEITTGKGLLENFGITEPLPTLALAVTGLVGVLTAFFIFQSASRN